MLFCLDIHLIPVIVLNLFFSSPVLQAINEDSSTVPGLLTDYILKGKEHRNRKLMLQRLYHNQEIRKELTVYSTRRFGNFNLTGHH